MTRANTSTPRTRPVPRLRGVLPGLPGQARHRRIAAHFGTNLAGTYLRVEYAQDIDGFWLEPHTDLGVKNLHDAALHVEEPAATQRSAPTSTTPTRSTSGAPRSRPTRRMVFVPSNITYHGFEPRKIEGIRKSVIINYVTNDWRAREQLAFPDRPIGG